MKPRSRFPLSLLVVIAFVVSMAHSGTALAATEDRLLTPTATQVGVFAGVSYVRYDGIFEGETTTGAFRVPYRITAPAEPEVGNRTVLVEPSHFAAGLVALNRNLGSTFLFERGFAHAGVGWSTAAFGAGRDQRILDPSVPGVFIEGGSVDSGGRTDHEIISDFARALGSDPTAGSMLGQLARRYVTGVSDSSYPVMSLITSGRAASLFDLALPFTTEWDDPQPAMAAGSFDGKLIVLNSEADASRNLVDRGVVPDRYRFYAVAGTPHVSDALDVPSFASRSTPASWIPALRAHFLQGHQWVLTGRPPPGSYHLQTSTSGETARDARGNAIAVDAAGRPVPRLPFIELGEARYITGFLGTYEDVRSVTDLGFRDHPAYMRAFREALAAYRNAGYILAEDAAAMRARAGGCSPLTFTEAYRDRYENFVSIQACTG